MTVLATSNKSSTPNISNAPNRPPASADYLESLNDEQRAAVEYDGQRGPLLVIAGAGSGKTKTLAHRVAHLTVNGADPQRILMLTFSRRAAAEMSRRVGLIVQQVIGAPATQRPLHFPWAGTFHGIGARLLRDYAERIGLAPSFTIHDRADSEDLLALVRHDLKFSTTQKRFPTKGTCMTIYSRTVNSEQPLAEVLMRTFPWCAGWETELKQLFARYVAAKQAQNILDYDDLLLYWSQMAAEPAFAAELGARFDHVLVDEYQDTNRLQASILLALKPDGRGLTVVGDDAQSIYSFRAATVRNILDFPIHFDPPAQVTTLERNYRSTRPILDASNAVIDLAKERFTKNLWTDRIGSAKPRLVTVRDEADQARYVADGILEMRESGVPLKAQAVLFRTSSHSAALELELIRRNIPFVKFGGLKFLEAAHIKDVLSALRWAENPRDRLAGFRVATLLPGVGPVTAGKLLDTMESAANPVDALIRFQMPNAAAGDWSAFVKHFALLNRAEAVWPGDVESTVEWYESHLTRRYDDAAIRMGDLLQLQRIAATYATRERFLTEITLDPPEATSDKSGVPHRDEDYLILSTIHSAKGQEWRAVSLLNVVDGCIPSDMATGSSAEIEEERRLLYVAMTRAKDQLQLIVPQRFYVHQQAGFGDRHVYASRSRFISNTVAQFFEPTEWPQPDTAEATARQGQRAGNVDLASKLKTMWT
ncbi:MAG: ATP-dependent helicase [Propionivibrio sp.]|nr:ATP-dependent helicase [Propionivibrio sp.]MBK8894857.1 ATP-dependent helicase [Propionivibrio sp.]